MRLLFAILAAMTLATCAGREDERFRVGEAPKGYVILGLAESSENTSPSYIVAWRHLGPDGAFSEYDGDRVFEARTNARASERIRGIPGEFFMGEVEPGVYALDGVFGIIRDGRVNYVAQGVIPGPERPSFEVRPGEAVYIGIWQMDIVDAGATTRLWRLDRSDLDAVLRQANPVRGGDVRVRETHERAVPCAPHRLNMMSTRQVC